MKTKGEAIIVEFTGVTGAGKTTLAAAVMDALSEQGFLAQDAYEVVLTAHRLNFVRHRKLRSVLIDILALWPFLHYIVTEKGRQLFSLAIHVIRRDAGTFLVAANLMRNFAKRIGVHMLLRSLRHQSCECDFILCDEGILHAVHNLFVHVDTVPNSNEIASFGNIVPKPDIVIRVKAPKEQSIACILQRGHGRVGSSPTEVQVFVQHGHFAFDTLCSLKSIQDKLFTVDNSFGDVTDNAIENRASAITEFLRRNCLMRSGI